MFKTNQKKVCKVHTHINCKCHLVNERHSTALTSWFIFVTNTTEMPLPTYIFTVCNCNVMPVTHEAGHVNSNL